MQSPRSTTKEKMCNISGTLWMGEGTLKVPMSLFIENRKRLVERMRRTNLPKNSIVFMQGGSDFRFYDTDVNFVFRQESYFMWTFGVLEPDCFGAIEVDTGKAHLFVPRLSKKHAIWMGPINSLEHISKKYSIDNVQYSDCIAEVLKGLNTSTLLILKGVNRNTSLEPKEPYFQGIEDFEIDKERLYNEIAELRVVKTDAEVKVLRYVVEVSSAAHRKVMRMAKVGKSEYQCESEFLHYCYSVGGCRNVAYLCVCASGPNSAILHYGHAGSPNDRFLKKGDMCLFDMGANYFGYAADITCSFPVIGKFSCNQKCIYQAVLKANLAVAGAAKPGVNWMDMQLLSNRTLLTNLEKGGLLQGDVDEMMKVDLAYTFQPHGLGHLIGLDVHDVGGYFPEPGARQSEQRTNRNLLEGMVLTIEPGCYFIDILLDKALEDPNKSKFLVADVIKRFRGFGGVRIEDTVLVTATGIENLTKVPRTVIEVENWMDNKDDEKY